MSDNNSKARTEAIQAVVDRVSAYQESSPDSTVEAELRKALQETDVSLSDEEVTSLAQAIESGEGNVSVAEVLPG